jgi:hypothetical protein
VGSEEKDELAARLADEKSSENRIVVAHKFPIAVDDVDSLHALIERLLGVLPRDTARNTSRRGPKARVAEVAAVGHRAVVRECL